MPPENKDIPEKQTPEELLVTLDNSRTFQRINIEYISLYRNIDTTQLRLSIRRGIEDKLTPFTTDRERAAQWRAAYTSALTNISEYLSQTLTQQNKQLPTIGLQQLSDDPQLLLKTLAKNPNDYLCHFQLAWLYSQSGHLLLAERHFNVAAIQSQITNPTFACYAFRHLADIRYRVSKLPQALLAIESARENNGTFNPELQFEYIRMLSVAQRTTQALKQLALLISKAPHYETLAHYEPDLLRNPSLKRFLAQLRQQHQQNVTNNILIQWDNDPLRLLDLDKEFGQKHSLEALRKKQQFSLERMPPLLLQNEAQASQLIQQQSRHFVMNTLDVKKQSYIQQIEIHQGRAERIHLLGQYLIYITVISLMALALSYGVSSIASLFEQRWPVNSAIQAIVLVIAAILGSCGMLLLHFSPKKLSRLLKQKQRLEQLSSRLGMST